MTPAEMREKLLELAEWFEVEAMIDNENNNPTGAGIDKKRAAFLRQVAETMKEPKLQHLYRCDETDGKTLFGSARPKEKE